MLGRLAAVAVLLTLAGCGGDAGDRDADRGPAAAAGTASDERTPLVQGGERIVFIGDSLAVEAPPNYPELLPEALGDRAPGVTTINLAEPGTTAADWSPGSPLFAERLLPELASADLVVVTLGGNDLQEGLGAGDGIGGLAAGTASSGDAFAAIDRFGGGSPGSSRRSAAAPPTRGSCSSATPTTRRRAPGAPRPGRSAPRP